MKKQTSKPTQDDAFDFVRNTVSVENITLPIANLRALWIIGQMGKWLKPDDPMSLVAILWVLINQDDDKVLVAANILPDMTELTTLAAKINMANLPDYLKALELMFCHCKSGQYPDTSKS